MPGVTLDAGGLIALDRNDRRVVVLLARARETGARVTVPATALAQAIRAARRVALFTSAYSLVAISTESATSPILHGSWKRLSHYAAEQDGVVVAWDAVLPDAIYLGVARADHLAVALALDDGKKGGKTGDPSRFPRDALLEAVVRFVTQ
jgi:hypothetical protein